MTGCGGGSGASQVDSNQTDSNQTETNQTKSTQIESNQTKSDQIDYSKMKVRIMPLGDSITYDDAHVYYDKNGKNKVPAGKRTAYRSFLAYDLNDAGVKYDFVGSRAAGYSIKPKFDPDNEGHPGWTSFDISKRVYRYLDHSPADVVLLHIGTNDKQGGRIDGIRKVIDEIKIWAKNHKRKIKIFVALIINREFRDYTIDKYNNNLREMLLSRNDPDIIIVDMSHLLSGTGDYIENTHPNKHGYKKIADKWFKALMDNLY